jgi:tRNA (mo5U34)-methyltransferase
MTFDEAQKLVAQVPHWHHRFEVFPGIMTPGTYSPHFMLDKIALPASLGGVRLLDIGASDGFFTREMHSRGADVVAYDYRKKESSGFYINERIYGRPLTHVNGNVYDLSPDKLGTFDVVLFLGVLYHLPDPLRAMWLVRKVTRGHAVLETHCYHDLMPDEPVAKYHRGDTLVGDWTNFWTPNRRALLDLAYDACFDVVREESWGDRILLQLAPSDDPVRIRKMETAYGRI